MKPNLICLVLVILLDFAVAKSFAQTTEEDRKVTPFSSIVLATSGDVHIYVRVHRTAAIKIKADQKQLGEIKSSVQNGTLTIEMSNYNSKGRVDIVIDVPRLDHISMTGTGFVQILPHFNYDDFQTDLAIDHSTHVRHEAQSHLADFRKSRT